MSDALDGVRRTAAIAGVAGPALFVVDNLLHPTEFAHRHAREQLAEIAHSGDRWQLAHAFGGGTLVLGMVFLLGLFLIVRPHAPTAATVGIVLSLAGLMANAFLLALDGFTWGTLGEVSGRAGVDQATLQTTLDAVQTSGWATPYYAAAGLIPIGVAITLYLALKHGELRTPEVAVYGVSMLMVAVESEVHSNGYFIASAVVYLLAGVLMARGLLAARPR